MKDNNDVTNGLNYNQFMSLIDSKLEKVKDCFNYDSFKLDVEVLKNANTGTGLSAITANNWLKKICNVNEIELKNYVENYEPGLLNPYTDKEIQDEEEEER